MTNWFLVGKLCNNRISGPPTNAQSNIKDMHHLLHCSEESHWFYLSMQIEKLEQHLCLKKILPLVVTTMLDILFPPQY